MKDLEQIMVDNWKKVRESFNYPNLPTPILNGKGTAKIDMENHEIEVNKNFVEEFREKGVDYDTIFTGLLSHEINHYLTCPFDLKRKLQMYNSARKVDENVAEKSSGIYSDLVDNLDLIMKKGVNEVGELLKAQGADNPLSKVILAYYQRATGFDMEFDAENELDDFMKEQLERLFTIDFLNTSKEKRNVKRFTKIVRDIMNQYDIQTSEEVLDLGIFENGAYSKNEVDRALRELSKEMEKGEFDELVKTIPGMEEGENDQDKNILYYQKLAENYRINIKKRKMEQNGGLFPHSHKEMELDDSPSDIAVYSSLGKPFIPGLGKVWTKKGGKHYAKKESTPNVLVMKDISGSMNSSEPHAETACVATVNAYLENESQAAVYLFNEQVDENELTKGYQTDPESLHRALTKSNDGGTKIDKESLNKLDEIIKRSEGELDIVMVTDLNIEGREDLFRYLHDRQDAHHVSIIYTGNEDINDLKNKYGGDNVSIYDVKKPEEIPNVVIGEVSKSIK